ncbi:MAG: carbamoyl phosphate synthase large subunit, partial [Bacteroidetes bacterium RIFCSPHIGHO2_02_FULL_44_7]
GLHTPRSKAVKTVMLALKAAGIIGYPVIIRSAYSLGGLGSAFAKNGHELKRLAQIAFTSAEQILIEKDLTGWKEIEYEVLRDREDNCVIVCNMENMDPMGIHTGESIVVAPSQTLTNFEYHTLREIAIKLIRHLGVIGECNVQFALQPRRKQGSMRYRIIEVNARLSRSSALASKATGYPLAFVASKLALGYTLPELKNAITKTTSAFFEPALDYVVVKMPRWDLDKFKQAKHDIGSQMKSVGEVMAIGRNFEEAIQKASRMLGLDQNGIIASYERLKAKYPHIKHSINGESTKEKLSELIKNPNEHRLLAITQALKMGISVDKIAYWSKIDEWFISKLKNITDLMKSLKKKRALEASLVREAKNKGFSDKQIAVLCKQTEESVFDFRRNSGILPKINHIDTLAGEFPAQTNYLYLTYPLSPQPTENNVTSPYPREVKQNKKILILGSGVYRIGSSVEFDWCAVTCGQMLRKMGYHRIVINHNPETVSTDYDMADTLYFEELNFETIREIYRRENPLGIILSMGGQTPNNIAIRCRDGGLNILGTSAESIDKAENRYKFSKLLTHLEIDQPAWRELTNIKGAKQFAEGVEYPVLVRPSYVLSGAAMNIAFNSDDLEKYLKEATYISPEHPVVITKFIIGAKEIEVDAVAFKGKILTDIVSEHIENAGVHFGDATIVCPPQKLYVETLRRIKVITAQIGKTLEVTGPFNIQFLAKENDIKVIECNLRASRSFPFVSKITNVNLAEISTRAIISMLEQRRLRTSFDCNLLNIPYVGVKAPQFSFSRLKGADPILSVEMASTGEVAALGKNLEEAYLKSIIATGFNLPKKGVLLSLGGELNKTKFLSSAKNLYESGLKIYATHHTMLYLRGHGMEAVQLYKLHEMPQ